MRVSDGKAVPDGTELLISSMWAYVSLDPDDHTEGVVAYLRPEDNLWMPMVGADMEMAQHILPKAAAVARLTDTKVSLVRFTTREVLIDDITKEPDA